MTEAKTKTTAKKPAAKKAAPKSEAPKAEAPKTTEVIKERLPEFLKASTDGWKEVRDARIEFAQENVNNYFETLKASYEAKSFSEASNIRNEYAKNAVLRQFEQARELGEVARKAQKEAWDALGIKLPKMFDRAA